jgi:CRISPR-associated endonuclease/helicase Cas3
VLLQRIGRLHRHDNPRPRGFERPRVVLLSPPDLAPLLAKADFGMGGDFGPYRDLVMLEATRRFAASLNTWRIPEMNRALVEGATHPAALEALTAGLEIAEPRWRRHRQDLAGGKLGDSYQAQHARLNWETRFDDDGFAFPEHERFGTRLGAEDLQVLLPAGTIGPFGKEIFAISIPAHWAVGLDFTLSPTADVDTTGNGIFITVLGRRFRYDRFGLQRV